jgi:hypothetical protein
MTRLLFWILDRLTISGGWAELAEIVEDYKKEVAARPTQPQLPFGGCPCREKDPNRHEGDTTDGGW